MTEKVTISTEDCTRIDKEYFNKVLKAVDAFVETQTQITDCGVEFKSEEVLAAESIGLDIVAAVQGDLEYAVIEDSKLEVISGLL